MSLDKNDLTKIECDISTTLKKSAVEAKSTTERFDFFETSSEMRKSIGKPSF